MERPPIPVRSASPLPPGVPTGPRNQNKYKDRDGNAPAVDGLDYGGGNKDGARTGSGEPEDRGMRSDTGSLCPLSPTPIYSFLSVSPPESAEVRRP